MCNQTGSVQLPPLTPLVYSALCAETLYFPHEIYEQREPNLPFFFVSKSFSANREPSVPSTAATSLRRGDYLC